ncbi:MAG: InlB B-repeat-containing protein [Clostridia bacterium]|nr:InlB B-repeat-containing protein [Clostridia bacterium]
MKNFFKKAIWIGILSTLVITTFTACNQESVAGPAGPQGEKGEPGIQGEKGEPGASGKGIERIEKSATDGLNDTYTITFTDGSTTSFTIANGTQGEKGDKGDTGAQGEKGDKGDTGAQGEKGDKGDTGAQGEKGDKGDTGAQGEKGDKGDTGAQGEKGDQGDTGAQGEDGTNGISVTNAYIDENLHLIILLSDGTKLDAGFVGVSSEPEVQKYTVTFVDHDGTQLKKETVNEGASAKAPGIPQRNGYVFVGWDKSYDNVTENITVTAQYRKLEGATVMVNSTTAKVGDNTVEVVISLLDNPGIASMKFNVLYDSSLTLKAVAFDPAFGAYVTAPEPYANPQSISLISPLSDINASGKMVTLSFEISQDVTASELLSIAVQLDAENIFDSDFESIDFTAISGYVEITE